MPAPYPFDDTGVASTNLVIGELHTLSITSDPIYRTIIPTYAPFYVDNLTVKHIDQSGTARTLIENQDFILVFQYLAATRSIGKPIYGGIHIIDPQLSGNFEIEYQTIGGDWVGDPNAVLFNLADNGYNPRQVAWDQITNVQDLFPPELHPQNINDVTNYQDLIGAISQITDAIANKPIEANPVVAHETRTDNPHSVTKTQVGLGNVANYPIAADQDVEDELELDRYVTLRQIVQFLRREYNIIYPGYTFVRNRQYTFQVDTLHIPDGYTLYWDILYITTTPYDFRTQSGVTVVTKGRADIILQTSTPNLGTEKYFQLLVRVNGPDGAVVAKTPKLTLIDEPIGYVSENFRTLDMISSTHCGVVKALGYGLYSKYLMTDIGYITNDNITSDGRINDRSYLIGHDVLLYPGMELIQGYGKSCIKSGMTYLLGLDNAPVVTNTTPVTNTPPSTTTTTTSGDGSFSFIEYRLQSCLWGINTGIGVIDEVGGQLFEYTTPTTGVAPDTEYYAIDYVLHECMWPTLYGVGFEDKSGGYSAMFGVPIGLQ